MARICVMYMNGDRWGSSTGRLYGEIAKCWLHFYRQSGTTAKPILVTDEESDTSFWPLEVARVKIPNFDKVDNFGRWETPERFYQLEVVGWLGAVSYDLVGPCIVMEPDTVILRNIDEMFDIDCKMGCCEFSPLDRRYTLPGVTPESRPLIRDWKTNKTIPGNLLMGGVQIHNVSMSEMYRYYYERRREDWIWDARYENGEKCGLAVVEFIYSIICSQIGIALPNKYNWLNMWGPYPDDTRVLHFNGDIVHKNQMLSLLGKKTPPKHLL